VTSFTEGRLFAFEPQGESSLCDREIQFRGMELMKSLNSGKTALEGQTFFLELVNKAELSS
jgi:hypothetical protein